MALLDEGTHVREVRDSIEAAVGVGGIGTQQSAIETLLDDLCASAKDDDGGGLQRIAGGAGAADSSASKANNNSAWHRRMPSNSSSIASSSTVSSSTTQQHQHQKLSNASAALTPASCWASGVGSSTRCVGENF